MTEVTRSEPIDAPADRRVLEAGVVAVGTAVGATARWGSGELSDLDPTSGAFPWTTFLVNIVGCFLIGIVAEQLRGLARVGVATGVLGGFTTMSAFAVEANQLAAAREPMLAAVYTVGSVTFGAGAAWLGRRVARKGSGVAA